MTVAEIRKEIKWGNTIHNACRQITLKNGYRISVIRQDEVTSKETMDKILIEAVQEYLGQLN